MRTIERKVAQYLARRDLPDPWLLPQPPAR